MRSWQDIISERIQAYKAERATLIEEIHTRISRNDALDIVISELGLLLKSNDGGSGDSEIGQVLGKTVKALKSFETKRGDSQSLMLQVAKAEAYIEVSGACVLSDLKDATGLSSHQLDAVVDKSSRIIKVDGRYQLNGV